MDFMGLSDAAHRLVVTYSVGMIRRLEIAQSRLHRPQLLFLDEPTVGLDPVALAVGILRADANVPRLIV
jgi:ABC-2 type transport system ATP-binding protein